MIRLSIACIAFSLIVFSCKPAEDQGHDSPATIRTEMKSPKYAIVIHGGAGTIQRENMSTEKDSSYRAMLNTALDVGEKILAAGGSSLDAIEATIRIMEDSPLFNAGRGAVFTHEGKNAHDASIMEGSDQMAGAITGTSNVKHPISLARAVMEKSNHVMMAGKGAETFAAEVGLEQVDPKYFYTERRWNSLQRILKKEEAELEFTADDVDKKQGTVGCVALDKNGNIAAGTSTGGMTNKRYDRIGDSPVIGAGTFADNLTCGVSATGHGEFFIRFTVARDIAAMMEYGGYTLEEAGEKIINEKLVEKGGTGGVVALDRYGNISMPFNTSGMYRGWRKPGEQYVGIYKGE